MRGQVKGRAGEEFAFMLEVECKTRTDIWNRSCYLWRLWGSFLIGGRLLGINAPALIRKYTIPLIMDSFLHISYLSH